MATPALGPSFGVAPSGTWMCRSWLLVVAGRDAQTWERLRTTVLAAWIDSCITSPREPVFT
jgi:hypothetical protein